MTRPERIVIAESIVEEVVFVGILGEPETPDGPATPAPPTPAPATPDPERQRLGDAREGRAKWYRWGLQLVPQYIIPAARQRAHR